jgi:hypothetical protein
MIELCLFMLGMGVIAAAWLALFIKVLVLL